MSLPLVQYVTDFFNEVSLDRVSIIGAQHILGTTVEMFKHLFKKGLSPKNTFLIGKCYSSSKLAARELQKLGIYFCPTSFSFDSHRTFDEQYEENLYRFLLKVISRVKSGNKIIILDDGGSLIRAVHQVLSDFSNVFGVEQTSSGYNSLKVCLLSFPVINVARSPAKLFYESPMIADVVVKHVSKSISGLRMNGRKVLVIGGGSIGCSIYEQLKSEFDVVVYDSQPELSMIQESVFWDRLSKSDLVVGCTGKTVLPNNFYGFLKKGTFLVSASSSDREFDACSFRKYLKKYTNPHLDIQKEGIHLLNSGFPINFNGHKHSVPRNLIQLTRSLLVAAIFQLLSDPTNPNGLVTLDVEIQRNILRKFFSINRDLKNHLTNKQLSCKL